MKTEDIERWQELEDLKYRASLIQCRLTAEDEAADDAWYDEWSVQ